MDKATVISTLKKARAEHWALPAINVSSTDTAIAAMEGLEEAGSPGFVQVSIGSAKTLSHDGDPVEGAIVLGKTLRELRKQYSVPIFLHTDHCHVGMVDEYLIPLLKRLAVLKEQGEGKIFDSFMFDGSMAEIHENARIISEIVPLVQAVDGVLEVEAGGAWGGSEDGVGGGAKYSTPGDVKVIQDAMLDAGVAADEYLLAVAFGNAHGTAVKPVLRPGLLEEISEQTGVDSLYVFHGGSGSPAADVREAVADGVVKMNVDTDTQYEFTRGVGEFLECAGLGVADDPRDRGSLKCEVWKSHADGKRFFDPRRWGAAGRKSMTAKVVSIAKLLGSYGKAVEL